MNTTNAIQESPKMVLVSEEELIELRTLKQELPSLLEKAKQEGIAEQKKMPLKLLNEKKKANPELFSKKSLEHYHKNKEEINKRRRERYIAKKATVRLESSEQNTPDL
jgi:hypothetical protein